MLRLRAVVHGLREGTDEWRAALRETAAMYRTLAALRRAKSAGALAPGRDTFRALAARFPGSLRELDTRALEGPDGIDARAAALETCAQGEAPVAPWMRALLAWHAWMRAALYLKPRLAARARRASRPGHDGHHDHDDDARLCAQVLARHGVAIDAAFVRAVANPPQGRLRTVVLARVGAHTGEAPEQVARALFSARIAVARAPAEREEG